MSLTRITLEQILIILVIIVIGIVCYRSKLIDKKTNEKLTNILLKLVNPMVIIVSYQREFSIKLMKGLLISFLLAITTHVFSIFISRLLIRDKKRKLVKVDGRQTLEKVDNPESVIESLSVIYSNCAFMGIPLVNGIFGGEGVFYVTAYITIWNIFIWTHGVMIMDDRQRSSKINFFDLLKKLASPSIIAIVIGLFLFLVRIQLPTVIYSAFDYIASINTPFAMLVAGVTIGQTNILSIFKNIRVYYISFIRLLLIPVLLLVIYSLFPISNIVLLTSIILTACPTATMSILFAVQYKKNSLYAAEIFGVTTLLSGITIPIIIIIAEMLI